MQTEGLGPDAAREQILFRRFADGELHADEFRELEQRLTTDAELRLRYVRFMGLETGLYETVRQAPMTASSTPVGRSVGRRRFGRSTAIVAACLAIGLIAAGMLFQSFRTGAPPQFANDGDAESADTVGFLDAALRMPREAAADATHIAAAAIEFSEALRPGLQDAAILTHVQTPEGMTGAGDLVPGVRLKPGHLTVADGCSVQLEFLKGAQVVLEGPAELLILSMSSATLKSGRAAANVPPAASGFVLNAPDVAVVDLGTKFAMSVNDRAESEVHVIKGEVEVSRLGDDGSTLISERLEESKTLRVGSGSSGLEIVEGPNWPLPTLKEQPAPALNVPPEYVAAVRESSPLIYWRFESLVDGLVPNEMGDDWSAQLHSAAGASPTMVVQDGMVRFSAGDVPRYLGPVGKIPDLNAESFTIEFWVNPDRLQFSTLVSLRPEGLKWRNHISNVIELAHETSMVHTPGAFRFLHRHPPSRKGGVNLFTPEGCTPGQWHHLVVMKTPKKSEIYVNGNLARRIEGKMETDETVYRLIIGQLTTRSPGRQFVGAFDEFALYRRALSEQEIRRHYQLLMGDLTEMD